MDLRENRAMELESGIAAFETKNFAHATKLLSPIAEEGNVDALDRMAIMLQNGLGCLANEDKAFLYMTKAAEDGLPLAMHALGFMYFEGECTEKDFYPANKAGSFSHSLGPCLQEDPALR